MVINQPVQRRCFLDLEFDSIRVSLAMMAPLQVRT